jgi:protein gp37
MTSKIEWCDETINPIIGCSKISVGCQNCYAERMACRLACMAMSKEGENSLTPYTAVVNGKISPKDDEWDKPTGWSGKTTFVESALEKPLRWKKPRRIFVCSMGDLFHESVNIRGDEIRSIFRVMASTEHTYMLLTKRPTRMAACIDYLYEDFAEELPNVWLGVTTENQQTADERVPILMQIPATVRFVSVEPMLGPIKLPWLRYGILDPNYFNVIDWVICGGESGPGARPMHPDWARDLRDQCKEAGTPFFFKSWGEWVSEFHPAFDPSKKISEVFVELERDSDNVAVDYRGEYMARVGKKKAGRKIDGLTWDQFPVQATHKDNL